MGVRSGLAGHAMLPFLRQAMVISLVFALAGCAVRRLEDIIGPPPAISQSDQQLAATSGDSQLTTGSATPDLSGADPELQASPTSEPAPSILSVPRFVDRAHWQAFHSIEGYDVTNAAGTICSGRMIGGAAGIVKGQRVPLACSDGENVTLLVTELTAGGGTGVILAGKFKQSATITDSQ